MTEQILKKKTKSGNSVYCNTTDKPEVKEGEDVRVPRLQVHGKRALPLTPALAIGVRHEATGKERQPASQRNAVSGDH